MQVWEGSWNSTCVSANPIPLLGLIHSPAPVLGLFASVGLCHTAGTCGKAPVLYGALGAASTSATCVPPMLLLVQKEPITSIADKLVQSIIKDPMIKHAEQVLLKENWHGFRKGSSRQVSITGMPMEPSIWHCMLGLFDAFIPHLFANCGRRLTKYTRIPSSQNRKNILKWSIIKPSKAAILGATVQQ